MKRPYILHVVPDMRRAAGGISATLPALCHALGAEGIPSTILTRAQDADGQATLLPPHALCRVLRDHMRHHRDAARQEGRGLICHSHGLWSALNHAAACAARREGVPLVISLHGMLLPWARKHKAYRKGLAWHLYQARDLAGAQGVHVTSDAEAHAATAAGMRAPYAVIPFGIDLPPPDAIKAPRHPIALFLGRLHPIKNISALIDAFALAGMPDWRLKIVGRDEAGHRAVLERLAQQRGVADRVEIGGFVEGDEKARLLAEAALVVLPSHSENFGVVVAEALASGTPALASTGTPWAVLEEESCGWWVGPDAQSLARALRHAAALPAEALRAQGARGRAYAEKALTWPRCAKRMAVFYRDALGKGGQP